MVEQSSFILLPVINIAYKFSGCLLIIRTIDNSPIDNISGGGLTAELSGIDG